MVRTRVGAVRRSGAVALVSLAMLLVGLGQVSAQADVTAVKGSAYGYSCVVSAFGQPCTPAGPTPTVTLASDASNSPQSAFVSSARADSGPATIFSSGRIDVSTQGTLGPTGSVTSSANIANVNASGQENFTASNLASSCTASETAASGSTTITGGTLQTDNGDSDPTNSIPDHPPVTVTLPTNPAPNTSYDGHVHIGNTTDTFTWVFNEQIVNPDGSITVNAAHEYLHGPSAVGDLILGQVVCGVTAGAPPPPPPSADLSVDVTGPATAPAGEVTYTVNVTNAGPDTATGVTVASKISGGKFVSSNNATCAPYKGKIRCDLGDVAQGTPESFTLVIKKGRRAISATSPVSSTTSDPNTANNSDTQTTTTP
jgi:uncharacterized repeat protein (TIGR01451 family)